MSSVLTAKAAKTKTMDNKEQTVMTTMATKKNVVVMMQAAAQKQAVAPVQELREASTGRVVVVRKLWAVGEPVAEMGKLLEFVKPAEKKETPKPEMAFYRKYTEAMLRRYLRMAMESGRVPSLLGRELFRSKVTSYRVRSFEDVIIFCFDMERCLAKLNGEERELIKRVALQEYTHAETAGMLGISQRTVGTRYGKALDRLTKLLLESKMLEPMHGNA